MSKYAVFFTLKGEAIAQAMEQPTDRVVVVSKAVESAGGKLEAYYLMFGQYDGFVIVDLPDSRAAAATSLAVRASGPSSTWRPTSSSRQRTSIRFWSRPRASPPSSQAPSPKPGSAQLTRFPERPEFRSPFARAYSEALIGSGRSCPIQAHKRPPGGGRTGWFVGAGYWGSTSRTLAAWGPFGPAVTSNSTTWPSSSER